MQVDYKNYLPNEFRASAIQLYLTALKEKLVPILGSDGKVIEVLESNIATDKCLVAICDEKLVGIMGIQTNKGGFLNPSIFQRFMQDGKTHSRVVTILDPR